MKRFLMLATLVGGLTVAATANTAEANPGYGGFGRGHYHGYAPRPYYPVGGYYPTGNFVGVSYGAYYRPGIFVGAPGYQFGYGAAGVPAYNYGYGYNTFGW